jgi:uncharacterized protein (TIGR03437 family)
VIGYMTGLGPLDTSGQLLRKGFRCRFDFAEEVVEYVGLAPQYAGVYQVNLRVPDNAAQAQSLTCGWDFETQAVVPVSISR